MRLILKEKGRAARSVQVPRGEFTLGRSRDADVRLDNFYASGKHCIFAYDGAELAVRDLATTNGTFLNGERIDQAAVRPGDRVLVGTALLLAVADGEGPNLQQLARQYEEANPEAREQVIGLLGELGNPAAVDLLVTALGDSEASVREAAAGALGTIGAPGAGAALATSLGDPCDAVRRRAKWALIRTADPSATPGVINAILRGQEDAQLAAITVAGMLRLNTASEAVSAALEAEVPAVREAAVKALGALGDPASVGRLQAALQEPERYPIAWVVAALGELGDADAVPDIVAQLDSPVVDVRAAAAYALGRAWTPESVPRLIAALDDSSASVRRSAAASLERVQRGIESRDTGDPGDPAKEEVADLDAGRDEAAGSASAAAAPLPLSIREDAAYWREWWNRMRESRSPEAGGA